jgi:hypothetical protein
LIQFKEAYITAASAIDKLKEPLLQLVQIREFLDATVAENLMTDADWAKFVNEDLCPGIAKRLAKEKSYQENVSVRSIRQNGRIFLISNRRVNL